MQQQNDCKLVIENEKRSIAVDREIVDFSSVVEIQAPAITYEDENRKSMDIVTILDMSSSMAGEKLRNVMNTMITLVDHLKPTDRLAIVIFSSSVHVLRELHNATPEWKEDTKEVIKRLCASGCTNLSGGLAMGAEIMLKRESQGQVSSLILMTDGQANQGVFGAELQSFSKNLMSNLGSTSLYTFGIGADHDAELLRLMASASNGTYTYIENSDNMRVTLAACLGGLESTVAQNVRVTIKAKENTRITNVATHFAVTTKEADKVYEVLIPDMFSEEKRDIFLTLSSTAEGSPVPLYDVLVEYMNTKLGAYLEMQANVEIERVGSEDGELSLLVERERLRLLALKTMADISDLGKRRMFVEVQGLVEKTLDIFEKSPVKTPILVNNLITLGKTFANERIYHESGISLVQVQNNSYSCQRVCQTTSCQPLEFASGFRAQAVANQSELVSPVVFNSTSNNSISGITLTSGTGTWDNHNNPNPITFSLGNNLTSIIANSLNNNNTITTTNSSSYAAIINSTSINNTFTISNNTNSWDTTSFQPLTVV